VMPIHIGEGRSSFRCLLIQMIISFQNLPETLRDNIH
jgi:hypothetical protein